MIVVYTILDLIYVRTGGADGIFKQLQPEDARYVLTNPIGNHQIILPGHCKNLLEELL